MTLSELWWRGMATRRIYYDPRPAWQQNLDGYLLWVKATGRDAMFKEALAAKARIDSEGMHHMSDLRKWAKHDDECTKWSDSLHRGWYLDPEKECTCGLDEALYQRIAALENGSPISLPLVVMSDGPAGRGVAICHTKNELADAIATFASGDYEITIKKYVEFQ